MIQQQCSVTFLPSGAHGLVPLGIALYEAAALLGVAMERPCGGTGACGRDLVSIRSHHGLVTALACRTRVDTDMEVTISLIEAAAMKTAGGYFSRDANPGPAAASIREACAPKPSGLKRCGLAIDIGTTTLEASLVGVPGGDTLAYVSMLNPLMGYGHDVMSRIRYATTNAGALQKMHAELIASVNLLIARLLSHRALDKKSVTHMAVAGNATMQHLFLGMPLHSLGSYPYETPLREPTMCAAGALSIDLDELAPVTVFPCIAPFVGGDIVAGLIAVEVKEREKPALFIDLGTNGELILLTRETTLAASCAAGPCFEGMSISSGMRASPGAVESVTLGDTIGLRVIGGGDARGICGSGLLELTSELIRVGLVHANGRLHRGEGDGVPENLSRLVRESNGKRSVRLNDALSVSQGDIRQVQLARAAIRTAVEFLIAKGNLRNQDMKTVIIAGGFGYHADKTALFRVGLLPALPNASLSFVGNASLEGARRMLVGESTMHDAVKISTSARTIELADEEGFEEAFVKNMRFD